MQLTVRQPLPTEESARRVAVSAGFGSLEVPRTDGGGDWLDMAPPANRRIALADDRIIGGEVWFDSALSLPGGGKVPVGALSGVAVDPGAHGKGAFRALLQDHLAVCRDRGDAASVLMTSEVPLYSRFGYGMAVPTAHWELDVAGAALDPAAPTAGRVEVDHDRNPAPVIEAWEAAGTARAGTLARDDTWWGFVLGTESTWLGGGKQLLARHTERPGYALYSVENVGGRQGLNEALVHVGELVAADVAVELDLWRFLTGLPWSRQVRWHYAPVDPAPLFWLRDTRQLRRMAHFDFLWVRPLDMTALVARRSFLGTDTVALQVDDPLYPDLGGRYDLRVLDGVGEWAPGKGEADLALGVADLGALWLGGSSAAQLRAVGRIAGDPRAALRLDRLLATEGPPRCQARF